jgi:hypothetical protein
LGAGPERLGIGFGYAAGGREAFLVSLWHVTERGRRVPTLFRSLFLLGILAGIAFAAMYALATFVEPEPRETTVTIPSSRLPPGSAGLSRGPSRSLVLLEPCSRRPV